MNRANERTATTRMRRDQQPQAHTDDSYRSPLRMRSGTECSKCGATYENGRWTWQASADKTRQIVCPACRRILDQVPAGELVLDGDYLAPRHDEVLGLLRNEAAGEAQQHPLERIMAVDAQPDHVTVRTTGPHLVRRLGEALLRAHQGELTISYGDGEGLLRGHWTRSAGK